MFSSFAAKRLFNKPLHLLFLSLLIISAIPLFSWYLSLPAIPGSDYFNTASYLQKLSQYPKIPALKWLYHWFSGHPLIFNYHNLNLYLMLPFVGVLGIIQVQNYYALVSIGLLLIFSYFLFFEISKDRIFSTIISIFVAYSFGIYASLLVVGSVTFSATQAFLPLTLIFLEKWKKSKNIKFLYLFSLTSGASITGHTGVGLAYILPVTLIYLASKKGNQKLENITKYLTIVAFISSYVFFPYVSGIFSRINPLKGEGKLFDLDYFPNSGSFFAGYLRTNPALFCITAFLAVFLVIFKKYKLSTLFKNTYLYIFIYLILINLLVYTGLKEISGLLFWPRSLWAIPIILGSLSASLYSQTKRGLNIYLKYGFLSILAISFLFLRHNSFNYIVKNAGKGYIHPGILSKNLTISEIVDLKKILAPSFLETANKQFRIYSLDDRVNMWWSALYDIPQTRGYFSGLTSDQEEFHLNQIDTSLLDNTYQTSLNTSEERAKNVAKFYIDWYAIKYFILTGRFKLSSYLESAAIIKKNVNIKGLNYLELDDSLTSPIIEISNSPALCFLGNDKAYNYFLRGLSRFNLGSNILIPVKGPAHIEQVNEKFLKACDSIVIYNLRTIPIPLNPLRSLGLKSLEKTIQKGTSAYLETGETNSLGSRGENFPNFFPISQTNQGSVGKSWSFAIKNDLLLDNVEVSSFAPPIWKSYPWKLSYSYQDKVRDWATSLITHDGLPILASGNFGQGKVIWSGMNLPFHMDYYDNESEARLLLNIINQILPNGTQENERFSTTIDWISPEKRMLTVSNGKGVLFRERYDSGWKANYNQENKLRIYPAGPNDPGFMYIKLPDKSKGASVNFSYSGNPLAWFYYLLIFVSVSFVLDEIFFSGKTISRWLKLLVKLLFVNISSSLKNWWRKEE